MGSNRTEETLTSWRLGQVQAERLVAQLLHLEGASRIEPQHPLGGPDGKKDILFEREGERWLAAIFFPTTLNSFSKIRKKFKEDAKGITPNHTVGIAFFVNQHLSVSERAQLAKEVAPRSADIYSCERIRAILDSPRGCGLRLQYLGLTMTEEEQWAFWQEMNSDIAQRIASSRVQLDRIEQKLDQVFIRTNNLLYDATSGPSSTLKATPNVVFATGSLDVNLLCWIHRVATEDSGVPESDRGRLRAVSIWLGKPGSAYGSANWHPPEPEDIRRLTEEVCARWRSIYSDLIHGPREEVLDALAFLHHDILAIHPFLDGNGRVARLLIDQAAHELLGSAVSKDLTADRAAYYGALESADRGDIGPLSKLIAAAIY